MTSSLGVLDLSDLVLDEMWFDATRLPLPARTDAEWTVLVDDPDDNVVDEAEIPAVGSSEITPGVEVLPVDDNMAAKERGELVDDVSQAAMSPEGGVAAENQTSFNAGQ